MANEVLLCHFDGNLTDETGNHTNFTFNGTFPTTHKFGTNSMLLSGQYFRINDNLEDFYFGLGDFTVDFWCYRYGDDNEMSVNVFYGTTSIIQTHFYHQIICYYINGSGLISTGITHPTGAWYHNAFVRYGDNIYYYLNGSKVHTLTGYGSISFAQPTFVGIGYSFQSFAYGASNYDEFRIIKGTAVWTGDSFEVPTQPYTLGPDYILSGNTAEDGKLILLSADDYSLISAEDVTSGSFELGVDYGKKLILVRNNNGKIDGVSEVMPAPV